MKKSFRIGFFLLLLPAVLLAQMGKGWSLSSTLHTGQILKHSPKLTIDNSGVSTGLTLNLQYQTYGLKAWQAQQHFPKVGIQLGYYYLSNHQQLGSAIGFLPNITIPFLRKEGWKLNGFLGFGVGWVTKFYDPLTSPNANAVGSHVNNYTAFGVHFEKRWTEQWDWTGGLSFAHFSNGSAQLPNYGLNLPAISMGLNYSPYPVAKEDYQHPEKTSYRKWGFFVQTTAARQEFIGLKGPKYYIYNVALAATYAENAVQISSFGLEYEYNYSVYNFFKFLDQYEEEETKDTGRRVMLFGGHEMRFGGVGLGLQIGVYVGPYRTLIRNSFYNKINLKYYFSPFGQKGLKPFISLHMKAHIVEAEYIALGVGIAL